MKIGVSEAVLWTLGTSACFHGLVVLLVRARREAAEDLVLLAGVQIVVYLSAAAWFAARRAGASWSEIFAVRRTSPWLWVLAALLGVALGPGAQVLAGAIERLAPLPPQLMERFAAQLRPKSAAHGVALAAVVCGFGPFVEELFFRGALFTALRPAFRAIVAALITATLFTITHSEPRFWPSTFGVGLAIGWVRAHSGSLWPPLLMHGAFNGTGLSMAWTADERGHTEIGGLLLGASLGLSGFLFFAFALVGRRSALAEQARSMDLERGPALPEGAS